MVLASCTDGGSVTTDAGVAEPVQGLGIESAPGRHRDLQRTQLGGALGGGATAFIASRVISAFGGSIEKLVALAD